MSDDILVDGEEDGDEFTELRDANVPRIDLVGKGANGIPFLIAKSDGGGLLDADTVRNLIKGVDVTAERGQRVEGGPVMDKVTLSGSAAAIAEMIHKAAVRKKDFDTAERKHDAATGAAMPDGSYPIENTDQLDDAIHAVGHGDASHDAIRRHIIARAKSLGASSKIPDNWNSDGSLKASVNKETTAMTDAVTKADDLDLDVPLDGAGEASPMPGSPEWEAIDAATACKWISVLARAKNAICLLSEREAQEAVVGDPDDAGNALALQDAESAIDCAVSILAPYAVSEQIEAGDEGDDLTLIGKAVAGADAPVGDIEALLPVMKAGRVLSGANETKLRDAVALLQQVLATLPAPTSDSGQPVAKEADMAGTESATAEQVEKATGELAAAGAAAQDTTERLAAAVASFNDAAPQLTLGIVQKAKGDPVVVVFNADGKLIGVVDPDDLMPVDNSGGSGGGSDNSDSDGDGDAASGGASADDAAAAAPAAPDAATIPGTDTVQAPADAGADDDQNDVQKSGQDGMALLDVVKAALEPLAEKADGVSDLASIVKALQERVEQIANMPDYRHSPAVNGVGNFGTGNEGTRGDEFAELRKAVDEADSPSAKRDALQRLAYAEVKARFQR